MAYFAAESDSENDESDSEDGYLNYEGAGDLDELSSDVGVQLDDINLDAASSDGEYVFSLFPLLASLH